MDSEAQKDLALDDREAEGVAGGREVAKKLAKHHAKGPGLTAPVVQVVAAPPAYTPPPGITQSANSGDDACAPEFGGDPGSLDGAT